MGPMIGPRAALGLEQGLPPVYIMGQRMILVYMLRMLFVIDLRGHKALWKTAQFATLAARRHELSHRGHRQGWLKPPDPLFQER